MRPQRGGVAGSILRKRATSTRRSVESRMVRVRRSSQQDVTCVRPPPAGATIRRCTSRWARGAARAGSREAGFRPPIHRRSSVDPALEREPSGPSGPAPGPHHHRTCRQTTHDARETRLVGQVVDLSPLRREGVEQDRLPRARLAGVQARSCHRNTVGWDQTFQARTGHQVPFYASRARSQRCFAIATSPNSAAATTYPTRVDPVATPLNPAKSSPGICAPLSTR